MPRRWGSEGTTHTTRICAGRKYPQNSLLSRPPRRGKQAGATAVVAGRITSRAAPFIIRAAENFAVIQHRLLMTTAAPQQHDSALSFSSAQKKKRGPGDKCTWRLFLLPPSLSPVSLRRWHPLLSQRRFEPREKRLGASRLVDRSLHPCLCPHPSFFRSSCASPAACRLPPKWTAHCWTESGCVSRNSAFLLADEFRPRLISSSFSHRPLLSALPSTRDTTMSLPFSKARATVPSTAPRFAFRMLSCTVSPFLHSRLRPLCLAGLKLANTLLQHDIPLSLRDVSQLCSFRC